MESQVAIGYRTSIASNLFIADGLVRTLVDIEHMPVVNYRPLALDNLDLFK